MVGRCSTPPETPNKQNGSLIAFIFYIGSLVGGSASVDLTKTLSMQSRRSGLGKSGIVEKE